HRQNHPLRRVHPRLPAATGSRFRRALALTGQDRARRSHAWDRQAPPGSGGSAGAAARQGQGARISKKLLDILKGSFGPAVIETQSEHGDETAVVDAGSWFKIARFLRDDPRCDMQMMVDLCGVDYPGREPRFDVVMHLYSIHLKHRLRLKTRVGD